MFEVAAEDWIGDDIDDVIVVVVFAHPFQRAGALLKVQVWDWDRSSPDDPLGHFEVKIGEELLSQEVSDSLAPGYTAAAATAVANATTTTTIYYYHYRYYHYYRYCYYYYYYYYCYYYYYYYYY